MSQTYVDFITTQNEQTQLKVSENNEKRKIKLTINNNHHISVFKNDNDVTAFNIRKGTRSVSLTMLELMELCDSKETLLLCYSFVEGGARL